jgi:hypothetical protein
MSISRSFVFMMEVERLLDHAHHGADPEHADGDGQEADAVHELEIAEREPLRAVDRIEPDHRQGEAEQRHRVAFRPRFAGQPADRGEAEQHQGEIFRRPEAQGVLGDRRRQDGQHDHAERAGDERGDRRNRERRSGAALAGHRVAVEARHQRRGFAGHVHQYGCDRAAVHAAVVDAAHEDHGGNRVHAEDERNEDGKRRDRTDARQRADQCPDDDTHRDDEEVHGTERDPETHVEVADEIHHSRKVKMPLGSGTLSHTANTT